MKLSEIERMCDRIGEGLRTYRFSVEVDGRMVLEDHEIDWRLSPRGAMSKFVRMMQKKYPCKELQVDMDWSR